MNSATLNHVKMPKRITYMPSTELEAESGKGEQFLKVLGAIMEVGFFSGAFGVLAMVILYLIFN